MELVTMSNFYSVTLLNHPVRNAFVLGVLVKDIEILRI
jgi:hypothetical protein